MKSLSLPKKIFLLVFAVCTSLLLILSLPMIHYFTLDTGVKKPNKIISNVTLKKITLDQTKKPPQRKLKKPQTKKPSRTQLKAGPRFAMDLGAMGGSGVSVHLDLTNKSGAGGGEQGDVDAKPSADFPPPFRLPREIREAEQDAYVVLSFCVDGSGRAYDIQITQERPAGMGLGNAGKEALNKTRFTPAMKDGSPVSFCGLEQPFEVKFDG